MIGLGEWCSMILFHLHWAGMVHSKACGLQAQKMHCHQCSFVSSGSSWHVQQSKPPVMQRTGTPYTSPNFWSNYKNQHVTHHNNLFCLPLLAHPHEVVCLLDVKLEHNKLQVIMQLVVLLWDWLNICKYNYLTNSKLIGVFRNKIKCS